VIEGRAARLGPLETW